MRQSRVWRGGAKESSHLPGNTCTRSTQINGQCWIYPPSTHNALLQSRLYNIYEFHALSQNLRCSKLQWGKGGVFFPGLLLSRCVDPYRFRQYPANRSQRDYYSEHSWKRPVLFRTRLLRHTPLTSAGLLETLPKQTLKDRPTRLKTPHGNRSWSAFVFT